jgi:hypothetical protein
MSTTPVAWGRPVRRRVSALASALMMLASNACSNNSTTTTPSTTTPSTTTYRERFTSTLPVGGSQFFSFSIATAGTVNATLESISGPGVPSSIVVDMGVGTPYQTTCSASQSEVQVSGNAGLTAVLTGTQQPGALCVIVSDPGNLFAPAMFTVVIDHP